MDREELSKKQCPECTLRRLGRRGARIVCSGCGSEFEEQRDGALACFMRLSSDRSSGSGRRLLRSGAQ